MLWKELEQHAEETHAGTWKVGSAGTPPTEESATSDARRWARNNPGKEQTYYPGEKEDVCEQNADGEGTTTTTRTTIGLANTRHITDGTDTITEDQDEKMISRARENEIANLIAEMDANNTADATHNSGQMADKREEEGQHQRHMRTDAHTMVTGRHTGTDIRLKRGGKEKRHDGLWAVARNVRRRL
jgi:hypothetical protein